MAINPETQYPGKIAPSSAGYPYGGARNITSPGDGRGTPWEAALVNDIFGFQQSMLARASVVPSGSPDEVGASQYLEASVLAFGSSHSDTTTMIADETLKSGQKVTTMGYYPGWAATKVPKGGNVYAIATLTEVRDALAIPAWVPDEQGGAFTLANALVAYSLANDANFYQFGCRGDNITNDTVPAQAAINYAATYGLYNVHAPAGTFLVDTLYTYYNVTLNPDYPSGVYGSGRLSIRGDRQMSGTSLAQSADYYGTVFRGTSATGQVFILNDDVQNGVAIEMKNLTVVGTSTGYLVDGNGVPQGSNFENLSMKNDGTAGGCLWTRGGMWTSSFRNMYLTCQGSGRTGTAWKAETLSLCHVDNVNLSHAGLGFDYGIVATADGDQGGGESSTFTNMQATNCSNGMHLQGGGFHTFNGLWIEQCDGDYDLKIDNEARNYTFLGAKFVSTGLAIGNVLVGDDTGTSYTDRVQNIVMINPWFGFCDNVGIIKYVGCTSLELYNPQFKNNGGDGIAIEEGAVSRTIVSNPNWFPEDATLEIPAASRVVDLATKSKAGWLVTQFDGEAINITGIASVAVVTCADNGSGLIRVTATTHLLTTGDMVQLAGVGGTTEANGAWEVIVIDADNYDLVGSTFTNAYTSGGNGTKFAIDMRDWTTVPKLLKASTITGDVFIALPTANIVGTELLIQKSNAASIVGLHAGSGGSTGIDGSVDVSVTATYDKIKVVNIGAGNWIREV